MKKIIIKILFLTLLAEPSFSQGLSLNPLRKADQLYHNFSYAKAISFYKKALQKERNIEYITSQIAMAYRNLNNEDSSEVWFKKAINLSPDTPINFFYLGESLMANGKYEEAKIYFQKYQQFAPNDTRVKKRLEAIVNLEQFDKGFLDVEINSVNYNSPGLDFSPAFFKDKLIFVSSRLKNKWQVKKEFNWDHSLFLDYYIADFETAEYYTGGLNTPYHEGPLVFYNNYQSVVYTRNNYDGKSLKKNEKGVTNLKLFFASWNEKERIWENEIPFEHNSDDYSNSAPAISNDGKILIFSSDRPGGYGESDLYISFKNDNGWSEPQNLGEIVNTQGRDGFPFLNGDQLFFASDGREGLGGLDIYLVDFNGKKTTGEVENIGKPFNSNKDDFGLILNDSIGYFTSNRIETNSDDIYFFQILKPKYVLVRGEVLDKDTEEGIIGSDVFFKNNQGEYLYTRTKENGKYQLLAPANSAWNISAGKYQYELIEPINVNINREDTVDVEKIYLKMITSYRDTLNIPNATPIIDNRTPPYQTISLSIDDFGAGDTLMFDIVYYDLDKADLRDTSKLILDKVSGFMIEHVDVKLILSSHTDSRASDMYNKALSQRRSNEVAKYLIEKGVDPSRIEKRNYGESILTNNCADGVDCSEEQHQFNRRTEIIFVKK
jgi:outer membrane protein OmpA-like peptidoglycan-associated protein